MTRRQIARFTREINRLAARELGRGTTLRGLEGYLVRELLADSGRPLRDRAPRPGLGFWPHVTARMLTPVVERHRIAVFGRPTPPFSSAEKAARWLDSRALPDEEREQILIGLIERRRKRPARFVDFLFPQGIMGPMMSVDPQVIEIVEFCQEIEQRTGWKNHDALAYVLVGTIPRLDPASQITMTSRGAPSDDWKLPGRAPFAWATVTVFPWQTDAATWEYIRLKLLSRMRVFTRGFTYSPEEGRLLDLVPIAGPPPIGKGKGRRVGRARYWDGLSREWRRRYREKIRPEALRMRWERFVSAYPEIAALASSAPETVPH